MKQLAVWIGALSIILGMAVMLAVAGQNPGAAEIILEGGKTGPVPFPHQKHQSALKECTVCHALFPQEDGAIEKLKADGTLKSKQVMNRHCVKCHRETRKTGGATGPVSCKTCHVKT